LEIGFTKEQDICDPLTAECKINLEIVENFQGPKTCCFLSTFTTHFTTFLPANHHVLRTTFPKTPLKNKGKLKVFTFGAMADFSGKN
jgi:hypothetical protein